MTAPATIANGLVRPCCMPANTPVAERRGDIVVRRCRTCGARHIELAVEPGRIFARG